MKFIIILSFDAHKSVLDTGKNPKTLSSVQKKKKKKPTVLVFFLKPWFFPTLPGILGFTWIARAIVHGPPVVAPQLRGESRI